MNINGEVLEKARLRRNLSLKEAADGIVSRQALHQWEKGRHRPGLDHLRQVCDRLRVRLEDVLVEEDAPQTGLAS